MSDTDPTTDLDTAPVHKRHKGPYIVVGIALIAALILIAVPLVVNVVQGIPYRYQGDHFSVSFPGKPTVAPNTDAQHFVRWQGGKTSLSVQSHSLGGEVPGGDVDAYLTQALTSGSSALGGKVTEAIHPITVGGEHALSVTFGTGGSDSVREVAFVHDGTFYALILSNASAEQDRAFLSSFAFAKKNL
ncbi:MAG: hypothetical protein JWR36_1887 [Glaciihabitans sp.]|jgi:hypothetical protein|nr:hypothetical protein [Glaciihabitans sp.]MDQ1570795.1 hypothetical protein [Actinomycetota bacterium]